MTEEQLTGLNNMKFGDALPVIRSHYPEDYQRILTIIKESLAVADDWYWKYDTRDSAVVDVMIKAINKELER